MLFQYRIKAEVGIVYLIPFIYCDEDRLAIHTLLNFEVPERSVPGQFEVECPIEQSAQLGKDVIYCILATRFRSTSLRVHANGLQIPVGHFYTRFSPTSPNYLAKSLLKTYTQEVRIFILLSGMKVTFSVDAGTIIEPPEPWHHQDEPELTGHHGHQ